MLGAGNLEDQVNANSSSTAGELSSPHAAQRIRLDRRHSSQNQAHSVGASHSLASHLGRSRKAPQTKTCPRAAPILPRACKISHVQRHNVEQKNPEKQEIHKKVEHDRRDLIKHWTLFLEELLPNALKLDPEVKAKNGKPNLPKKVIYQLACKYICFEHGKQEDYEAMLRAQPCDQSGMCPETIK